MDSSSTATYIHIYKRTYRNVPSVSMASAIYETNYNRGSTYPPTGPNHQISQTQTTNHQKRNSHQNIKEGGHTFAVMVCILPIFNSLWHHFWIVIFDA